MRSHRPHPLAAFTALVFVAAVTLPYLQYGFFRSAPLALSRLLLASPFLILFVGQLQRGVTWRHHLTLICLNFPLLIGWIFAQTLMWFFAPGLWGAVVLGMLLSLIAAMLVASSQVPRLESV